MCLYVLLVPFPNVDAPFLLAICISMNGSYHEMEAGVNGATYFNAVTKQEHRYRLTLVRPAEYK